MRVYVSFTLQVAFIQKISTADARGAVEKWLLQVQDIMLMSIRDVVARSKEVSTLPLALLTKLYLPPQTALLKMQKGVNPKQTKKKCAAFVPQRRRHTAV